MSEIKTLLKSLLKEIYGRTPSKNRLKKQRTKMHTKLYEKRLLEKLSPKVLKDICEILKFEIRLISKYLERVLISRDKNRTHRTILCGFLDILVASSKFGESSREMRFGISSPPNATAAITTQKGRGDATAPSTGRSIIPDETNSSSDFNQWLHAMKMVARLPGGMPPEFRRKLWLALADKYLKSKNVDWKKEEVKCFSEQWREDDEELGIQIVKDLHRTGSSLCSGPAGTLNQAKLKRILLGYARFNPEVGYCQGFNMLGALILQVMDKEEIESIKVMIYLVEGILPSGYFSGSLGGLQADMAVFRELMTSKLPRLAKHLQKLQGPVENAFEPPLTNVFTMQWFLTMFCTCLPMTCVLRVWDLVLIEGSDVLLRTALVLWSLLEERILNARTADDFYCQMGSFSSELLNGHLVDSNGLIEKVVDLGPITDLQKLRDKHLYNITPFRDKKGLQLYYSDEDGDSDEDSRMAVATAWGLRLRRGSAGLGSKSEGKDRIALDISLLKKQYDRLRERQRQAHIILTSAVARQGSNPNQSAIQMNQLLMGRQAIVTNHGRRIGPPQGAIPPARKPSLPTTKPPKLGQTKKLLSGETLHWRDTDLSKRRRGSLKWKDIKSDSSQSGLDDRPAPLIESAPSSRSSSSEPKSRRTTLKASRQRSDSSSYSEESDGNSSTSTSLCDEDEIAEHNNLSSLEGSPMRKVKSSKKHSEVSKQKSLEDVLNSNDGQPTVDNQIPFIQLTTIESPVLNANKNDIDHSEYNKEDSETESNRLDYAGFVDDFSWPDMNEPTSSVSLEDTTIDATSVEGDFLSLSNVITSTSQLSPMPDITTYINNSNISPLRTPISSFNYASLVVNMDESKKFDVNEEGVTNEYFERVNVVERPTKLDLLYSLNEEDSIRNAYVSCEPSPESSKDVEQPKLDVEPEVGNKAVVHVSDEEHDRKMKVLDEYSNKSSLSFIAEAKHEISSGMFRDVEFDVDSLKYQPSTLVPLKKAYPSGSKTDIDDTTEHVITVPSSVPKSSSSKSETDGDSKPDSQSEKMLDLNSPKASSPPKNLAEELAELEASANLKHESNVHPEEIKNNEEHAKEDEVITNVTSNIPSTEDLETRFRALEMSFSGRKDSLKNKTTQEDLPTSEKAVHTERPSERSSFSRSSIEQIDASSKRSSLMENIEEDLEFHSKKSIEEIDSSNLRDHSKKDSPTLKEVLQTEAFCERSSFSRSSIEQIDASSKRSSIMENIGEDLEFPSRKSIEEIDKKGSPTSKAVLQTEPSGESSSYSRDSIQEIDASSKRSSVMEDIGEDLGAQSESSFTRDVENSEKVKLTNQQLEDEKNVEEVSISFPSSENLDSNFDQNMSSLNENQFSNENMNESIPETKEEREDQSPSSTKKGLFPNTYPHSNRVSNLGDDSDTKLHRIEDTGESKQSEQPEEEQTNSTQIKRSSFTDPDEKALPAEGLKPVPKTFDDQTALEELVEEGITYEQKQSLSPNKEQKPISLHKNSSIEDLNKNHPSAENQDRYQYCASVEDELRKTYTEEVSQSSTLIENKEDLPLSSRSREHLNEDWKASDHRYQYQSHVEDSNQLNSSEDIKETHEFEKDNKIVCPASSSESTLDNDSKSTGKAFKKVDFEEKHKITSLRELVGEEKPANEEDLTIKESAEEVNQQIEDKGALDTEVKCSDRNGTSELKEDQDYSKSNIKEYSTEDTKSSDFTSKTALAKETTPLKNEELIPLTNKHPDDSIHVASPLKEDNLENPPIELPSDSQIANDDPIVHNLSDDSKQSLLPKGLNKKLHSLTTNEHSKEGDLFYEHHAANEYGSEIEGLNDPKQSEDNSSQGQSNNNESSSSQEKTPVEVESNQEKSIVQSTTDKSSTSKAIQKLDEKDQDFATITTVDNKPSSTYSFSYTQDHFKDHVSFLSEVQSSVSPKSSLANQNDTGALQSTFDLKHSLQDLVAVTTSVSFRNSASVKSSVSIKSSVSLKSSSLYDRERSLNVNAGITVNEDPKFDDSKMILSKQQLEIIKSNNGFNEENFRVNQSLLAENQNNRVTVSVVESDYKANTSNISLSMRLPNYSGDCLDRKHSRTEAILEREALQITEESSSANINSYEHKLKENVNESSKVQTEVKVVDESSKRKSSHSQDIDERLKALESRFSDRALSSSKDTKTALDQSANEEKEPTKEQILNLDDVQPIKLKHDASPPNKSIAETETTSKEGTDKVVPSTADLEHRFRELERKLSAKNVLMPTTKKEEEPQQESSTASKQTNSTTLNPSIVLSKNEDKSPCKDSDEASIHENISQTNEDQYSTPTRRRIPSTEDLETRFEALEIQKSLKSPTNLLSPSKIKEDFLVATNEVDLNRKSEIPSTEDLENRFEALEKSKKGDQISKAKNEDLKQIKICSKNKQIDNEHEERARTSTNESEENTNQHLEKDLRVKTKETPKVTFADTSDRKISSNKPSEETETVEEANNKSKESSTTCEFDRDRVLRKIPSARDLEARFEALEKRKSFTGFSTKTQEHLLAEQSRNYLSSDSLNSVESLKRREANDKKVASTEDLVLRLDALEQRMAITENSIKNKVSAETSDLSQVKKKLSPKLDFECKFEALDNFKPFSGETCTKENTDKRKSDGIKDKRPTLMKDLSQETKLNLIKRSLFEDKDPEPKWLPSTEDLENRFDALEKQKTKSLNSKKKIASEIEEIKPKINSYEPQTKSPQNWETRFEALDHRTPKPTPYSKTIPTWEIETQSKFPSTKDLESRFEALEQQKYNMERCTKLKDFHKKSSNERDYKPTAFIAKPIQKELEKPTKALSSRSIDQVIEQISSKTEQIEREHQMTSKVPSTQDLEIRYHDLQLNTKRGDDCDLENVQNLEQTTDSIELTGSHKRRDLYKLESQSDETLTVSDPTGTEFETKSESRPTSCPEYRDPFDSNIVTTDRVLKIIEENSKILHRILKKTLADSGGGNGNSAESVNSRSGFTDSLLALGNIFPRNDESISPSRIKSQSRVRSTITFRSDDSSITDRLASIKSTIKSIDTLCEDQSSRKDKCQRYIDSLFIARPSNATSPTPPIARPRIKVDEFESSSRTPPPQERVAMRELKKETSPRRRRDEDREEYESRVRRDMMPNNVDAPSEISCSLENIAKVDSEVDRINQDKQVETQLERPLSPYYAPGYDLNNRSITPVVYIPTKLEIRHTTVTSTFYDRYLTEKHIERTFPRSKKHSPISPTITKSHLDISNYGSPNLDDRSSKSAENSPSRRKDGLSPNQTVSAAAYRRSFISSLEVAQKDLHIRSCDNILLQLRSSTHNTDIVPSIMVYNPLPTKIRKTPELGISLGLYKDYGSDASSKS